MSRPDPITPRARELFDRASAGVDHGMAFRLRRARQAAQQPARALPGQRLLPAGAFAAAVLALGLAWWLPQRPSTGETPADPLAASEVDALVVEEDPDLYAWLAEAPVAVAEVRR